MNLSVKEVSPDNFDDLLNICPRKFLSDPYIKKGIEIKREWFKRIYEKYGSPVRICYINGKPVSQILYFPEKIVPYVKNPREGVLWINCIYNPYPEYQKQGCGRKLVYSIINDIKSGVEIFKGIPGYNFISTYPFDTGEYFPMTQFFIKMGFKTYDKNEYFYEIREGTYIELERPRYKYQEYDINKVIMFYEPWCEFSYRFMHLMTDKIMKLSEELGVELEFNIFDAWKYPDEYFKRGWNMIIVRSRVIKSFYGTSEFDEELRRHIKS